MIKIDGHKIKQLRESQGLTQLYIATVVEVTTDTISRWENKRYPSIKRENALKLAEALDAELDDILLIEKESADSTDNTPKKRSVDNKPYFSKFYATIAISIIVLSLCVALIHHYQNRQPIIQAQRIMPSNTIAGLPFPIVIQVQSSHSEPISLILKENIPKNCEILVTSPPVSSSATKGELKWIQKINTTSRFSYLVKIAKNAGEKTVFTGSVSISKGDDTSINVSGSNTVKSGDFHWADNDGNNQIDDQEILNVFDKYSDIDDFQINIDLIERMWLGSSYLWDKEKKLISIIP